MRQRHALAGPLRQIHALAQPASRAPLGSHAGKRTISLCFLLAHAGPRRKMHAFLLRCFCAPGSHAEKRKQMCMETASAPSKKQNAPRCERLRDSQSHTVIIWLNSAKTFIYLMLLFYLEFSAFLPTPPICAKASVRGEKIAAFSVMAFKAAVHAR